MAHKKIAKNQGESGRVNLSGSELEQFGSEIGDEVGVDVAESPAVAKAMIDTKDADRFIIISNTGRSSAEEQQE
jgi:hypothetical protein